MAEQLGKHFFFNLKTVNLIVERQTWKNNYHYIFVAYRATKGYHQMARYSLDMQARTQTYKQVCVCVRGCGANLNNLLKGVRTLRKFRF